MTKEQAHRKIAALVAYATELQDYLAQAKRIGRYDRETLCETITDRIAELEDTRAAIASLERAILAGVFEE